MAFSVSPLQDWKRPNRVARAARYLIAARAIIGDYSSGAS
jgi:hypothetical protein